MIRTRFWAAGVGACFVLGVAYATAVSIPEPSADAEHALAAQRACVDAVRERAAGARFPFGANLDRIGEASFRIHGTIDQIRAGEAVRRNYECRVRHLGPGVYRADSVRVWQSH